MPARDDFLENLASQLCQVVLRNTGTTVSLKVDSEKIGVKLSSFFYSSACMSSIFVRTSVHLALCFQLSMRRRKLQRQVVFVLKRCTYKRKVQDKEKQSILEVRSRFSCFFRKTALDLLGLFVLVAERCNCTVGCIRPGGSVAA